MFDMLLRLYKYNILSEPQLSKAVLKGWITEEQKQEIIQSKDSE